MGYLTNDDRAFFRDQGYLIKRDVPAHRIEAEGYGRAAPVASNSTLAGRRANRRVEIELRASEVGAYR